jgi:hypothetical protein
MPSLSKSGKASRDERERILKLKHRYENRVTVARYGKESLDAGDYGNAIRKFTDYLAIMAEVKEVRDIYELRVQHFDSKKELTEMLMISHIYFEMARLYDAVPKFHGDAQKCLDQFVAFTANQPFQVVNSEMIRKYLKKSVFKNPEIFRHAYQQIYVQSKKCYVVTFCYGDTHPITRECREFKDWLLDRSWGQELVRRYYVSSSVIVPIFERSPVLRFFGKSLGKPAVLLFSKIFLPAILKKC